MKKPIAEVVLELRDLFNIDSDNFFGSSEFDNKFMINKRQFSQHEVIDKLQNYFYDKTIDGGYLKVDSITFLHTTFEVISGKP